MYLVDAFNQTASQNLPHRITSAYKFSVDGPLGVKLLTLAGLVARSVQCLFVFLFCFITQTILNLI